MDYYWLTIYIIDVLLFVGVTLTVIYIVFFSIVSIFSKTRFAPKAKHQNRFIVIIPSYKDDKNIVHTVASILSQGYPQRLFDVVVVSDHQSEITNMKLAQYTITLLTPNFEKSTKVKSLPPDDGRVVCSFSPKTNILVTWPNDYRLFSAWLT